MSFRSIRGGLAECQRPGDGVEKWEEKVRDERVCVCGWEKKTQTDRKKERQTN